MTPARFLIGLFVAALFASAAPAGEVQAFGNQAGCDAFHENWDAVTDSMVLVTPDKTRRWESECALPKPNYDGTPMRLTCHGEGEEWEMMVELRVDPAQPDVMTYKDRYADDEEGASEPAETIQLSRCD